MEQRMSALSNAVSILRWLGENGPEAGVSELATALDLPKSTASRVLKDMAAHGLLERDHKSARYRVGLMLLEVGRHYGAGQPLIEAADATLADLTRRTGHATGISRLDGTEVVVLRSRAGTRPLRVVTPPGNRGPAWATSSGRCLLARLDDAGIAARFRVFPKSPLPAAPRSLAALMERLRAVRAAGWEEAEEESLPGVGAVSVAVADPRTDEAVALYFAFSALHVDRSERRALVALLQEAAGRLAVRFGDVPERMRRAHG
jgi:DNA-binding IclR family transcriptional regulator